MFGLNDGSLFAAGGRGCLDSVLDDRVTAHCVVWHQVTSGIR